MCGFDPHSSLEISFPGKKILGLVYKCYNTENSSLAAIQVAFHYHHMDSRSRERSFIYGPSRANIIVCISDNDINFYNNYSITNK